MEIWHNPRCSKSRQSLELVEHPRLIERPIVPNGDRAVVGRSPENVEALL